MQKYLGVKVVEAREMFRGDFNEYKFDDASICPPDASPDDEGYLVKYPDGYESWCPKKQFEEANRPINGLTFGHATEAARKGNKIARPSWNGKNMFVVIMPELKLPPFNTADTHRKVNDRTAKFIGEDAPLDCQPYWAMYNAQKQWIPGWIPTQSDTLAEDWEIIET